MQRSVHVVEVCVHDDHYSVYHPKNADKEKYVRVLAASEEAAKDAAVDFIADRLPARFHVGSAECVDERGFDLSKWELEVESEDDDEREPA